MMTRRHRMATVVGLAALVLVPIGISGQERELAPGAQWRYSNRAGEVLTLTIAQQASSEITWSGDRRARYIVHASGFRSFSSPPSLSESRYETCMVLEETVFFSTLAEFVEHVDVASRCDNARDGSFFYSFDEVIDHIERPILPPPRPRPIAVNDPQSHGIVPSTHAAPVYPPELMASKQDGWVLLQFTVTSEGRLKDVRVVDASPSGIFEPSALKFASIAGFQPKVVDGSVIEVEDVQLVVTYTHDQGRRVFEVAE